MQSQLGLGEDLLFLKSIHLRYVKIDAGQIADMVNNEIEAGFSVLKALVDTLNIKLVAVGVDSEVLYLRLKKLGVDAMQGNYIAEPERMS